MAQGIEAGIAGYYQKQVTGDSGSDSRGIMDHVFGIGPEISAFLPKVGAFASVRWIHELEARERPEGDTVTITITKPLGAPPPSK